MSKAVEMSIDLPASEILVADDNTDSLRLITGLLMEQGYQVRATDNPLLALEAALTHPPDLILLDVRMPKMNGFELCQRLKDDGRTADVPILFISASIDVADQVKGFHLGAQDYICKPIQREEVLARVRTHLELRRVKCDLEKLVEQRTAELKRREGALIKSQSLLRDLSSHMEQVKEEEMARISREIHDELGGTLTAIKLDMAWLNKRYQEGRAEEFDSMAEKVKAMSGMLDGLIGSTRRIVADLRPTLLDDLGLWAAIEWQVGEFAKRTAIEAQVQNECEERIFPRQNAIAIYRIVQEALTNVARHANASHVVVGCKVSEDQLRLYIQDDGVGFDRVLVEEKARSFGIRGMRERAASVGGELLVESHPDSGTRVEITLATNGQHHDE